MSTSFTGLCLLLLGATSSPRLRTARLPLTGMDLALLTPGRS
nr:hypothetical protein I308_04152 [Cryptococcus tetragattii IND107]